jgi:RNA polymerase sigma factor (sigma-70 family)
MSKQDIFDPSFAEDASAYRVKVMVKNNLLLSAIEAAGYKSVAAFSKEVGWNQTRVGSLIGLREAPLKANGEFSDLAKAIMEVLGAAPSDLWTTEQLNMSLLRNTSERVLDAKALQSVLGGNVLQLEGAVYEDEKPPEDSVYENDIKSVIKESLQALTPQQAKVLIFRFGIDCEQRTLLEVGAIMNLSPERIRQIETKGLRRLRHRTLKNSGLKELREDFSVDKYPSSIFYELLSEDDDELS